MLSTRSFLGPILVCLASSLLLACGASETSDTAAAPSEPANTTASAEPVPAEAEPEEAEAAAAAIAEDEDAEVVDADSLSEAGRIELKQYTVAYMASGSMGGGTLILGGKSYPFKIAGLGVGGIGASAIDATGTVYNLPSLEAFPGTYGNARLGITAGDAGKGRLWLKNPSGVVMELRSEMRGLALTGGVDGILIQWDDDKDTLAGDTIDGSKKLIGGGVEAGADAIGGTVDALKSPFE